MDEDDTMKLLREQRQRLLELRASSGMGEIARAEQQRREALRLIAGPSALAGIFSQQRTMVQLFAQTRPTLSFYESSGIGKLISQQGLMAGFKRPPLFDTSTWFKETVSPLFLAGVTKQLGSLNLGRSVVASQLKLISESLGGLNYASRFAEQLQEPLRQWREMFEQYEEDERRLLAAIVPLGWLISPSMGTRMIRMLAQELENSSVEEIDDALVRYFDPDQCAEIVEGLYNDPVFQEYGPLIGEGLAVHRDGNYRAAILVWLAAIDGIAEQKFGVRRVFAEVKKKNGGRLRALIEQTTRGREALHDALIDILKRASLRVPDPYVPKRDSVIHGREVDFGNERASIQLLLVLEVMHYCAPKAVGDGAKSPAEQPALTQ
jgi:hypothetical protein